MTPGAAADFEVAMSREMESASTTSAQAPGGLSVVQEFINTRYGGGPRYHEELESPERLRAWLVQWHMLAGDDPVSEGDLRRAIGVREALRALLRANTRAPAAPGAALADGLVAAAQTINAVAQHTPLAVRLRHDGHATLEPDIGGVDGALARLLAAVPMAQADGSWRWLKICRNDACSKAFYDTSKNHSGVWCAMSGCGNRLNARISRARRRQDHEQDHEAH